MPKTIPKRLPTGGLICGMIGTLETASWPAVFCCTKPLGHSGPHRLTLYTGDVLTDKSVRTATVAFGTRLKTFAPKPADFPMHRCDNWFRAIPRFATIADAGRAGQGVSLWCELTADHAGPHQRSHQVEHDETPIVVHWD